MTVPNPSKLEFTIVIFIHYKPRIAVATHDLQWEKMKLCLASATYTTSKCFVTFVVPTLLSVFQDLGYILLLTTDYMGGWLHGW